MKPVLAVLAILIAYTVTVTVLAEIRLNHYQSQIKELQCRHVLFEDGSSLHKDAELTAACIRR